MLIPFIVVPLVNVLLNYFVMAVGIAPLANGINIQWTTTPPILFGLIYYLFFRVVDKLELEKESSN